MSYYWHFVDVVWIALFAMIYLAAVTVWPSRRTVREQGPTLQRTQPMTSDTPAGRRPIRRLRVGCSAGARSRAEPARRRRLGAARPHVAALALAGGVYTAFAPGRATPRTTRTLSAAAQEGKALFDTSCITCHGRNAQGVEGRGPSLIGVGSAAVEFQVGTGRMPMARQEAQAEASRRSSTRTRPASSAQYIQELGGGPQLPERRAGRRPGASPRRSPAAASCSGSTAPSCHAFGGGGGALSSGKYAPALHGATDRQIYAAMLTGPQNMPVFGDNQLTPDEKRDDHRATSSTLQQDKDPGGFGLGRLGPVHRGPGDLPGRHGRLVFATLWIAGKS